MPSRFELSWLRSCLCRSSSLFSSLPLHHSYIFLLYAQPANFTAAAIAPLADAPLILGFNVSEFAGMTGLGDPVAGAYFLAGLSYNDA